VAERARYLMTAYPDLPDDPDKLLAAIDGLRRFHARSVIEEWQALAGRGDWQALAAALVTAHYDPAYDRARKRDDAALSRTILETGSLDDRALAGLAERVIAATPAA
ncbi:MAG: tRNA 2-selenouridine synthase, partial [Maricaulis maris]